MAAESPSQRREFSRVAVHLRAEVIANGRVHGSGTMENLSLKGGFFRSASPPRDGVPVEIRLHLDASEIEVRTRGFVVRSGDEGCAIQFTEIVGVDSLEHLRNIIRFNTRDPQKVEQEFSHHLGLKRPE